jgi:hypothetical protein
MTSNTPEHETSDGHETSHGHETSDGHETSHGHETSSTHDTSAPDAGAPVEPVQPASTDDVFDGSEHATPTASSARHDADGFAGEEREPYPIGATDAEPAPATASDDELVIDYGSAQEPEDAAAASEPPLTKPSPADDAHPYPPQALGEPAPRESGAAATAAAAAAGAAATDRDRDAADRASFDRDATARDDRDDRDDRSTDAASRPVYVQAPTPPKAKGNRGFGILVGVLATLVFGALYLLALVFVVTPVSGATDAPTAAILDTLASAVFYVPVIVFFLAWVLLVVILTRAAWWGYVIGGFFVGLLTYVGYLAGILAANAFEVAPSQVPQFLLDHLFDAPALLAFVIAREVPIWFGVWVGKRGRAVRVRNAEARDEYERILEAGPSARA